MRWIVLLSMLMLCACGAFGTKLEAPNLNVVGIEMMESDIFQQKFKLKLHVQNPNDRELPVKGVSANVQIAGQDFAQGVSAAQFTVPAFGESEFDMIVTASMATALARLLTSKDGGKRDAIDYKVTGKVSLASGMLRSIPFSESGSLPLKSPPTQSSPR